MFINNVKHGYYLYNGHSSVEYVGKRNCSLLVLLLENLFFEKNDFVL
jgi:hypothetical protein